MGLFSKKHHQVAAECPSGSVHAWKDLNGCLHEDKVEQERRDREILKARGFQRIVDYFTNYNIMSASRMDLNEYSITYDLILDKPLGPRDLAKILIEHWPLMREDLDRIMKESNGNF